MKSFKLMPGPGKLAARLADAQKRHLWKEILANPEYATNIARLGGALMRDGQYPEAAEVYVFGVRCHPHSYFLQLCLGAAYEYAGREADALRVYRRAIKSFPDRFRGYFRLEKLYRRGGCVGDAVNLYKGIPPANPLKEASFLRLFKIYARLGDLAAAVAVLLEAMKHYGESYQRCLEMGKLCFRQGDYLSAVQYFESAVAFRPQHVPTRVWLGIALKELGNGRLAEYEFNEVLRINPGSFQGLIHQAELKIKAKKFEEALAILDRLEKIAPGNARVNVCRGWIAMEKGDVPAAIVFCERGLKEANVYFIWEQVLAHRILERLMKAAGKAEESEYHARMAEAIAGKDTYDSLIHLAEKQVKKGDCKLAQRVLSRLLELFPHNTRAQIGLGEVFLKEGRLPEAILICQDALKRIHPIFLREKIRAHLVIAQAGKLQKSLRLYKQEQKAIRLLLKQIYLRPREAPGIGI
ncbi:MAG: tetratricopeptide repeat protein [Candidatus Aureabacteria bacterium]|nr:tetratricopeptide repeat protein [Candidatus Auribacterota bacterium]